MGTPSSGEYDLTKPPKTDWTEGAKKLAYAVKPYWALILYGYFILHCLFGALMFYFIEKQSELVLDSKVTTQETCIGAQNIWGAIFFYIAASSTIGFGILYPCTLITRIIAVIYSMVGIPLFIAVLAKFGDHFYKFVVIIYMPFWRKLQEKKELEIQLEDERRAEKRRVIRKHSEYGIYNNNSTATTPMLRVNSSGKIPLIDLDTMENFSVMENGGFASGKQSSCATPSEDLSDEKVKNMVSMILGDAEDDMQDKPDLPVSLGFLLILACVGLCGVFYYYMESFTKFDSLYYAFLTFLAGDFGTTTYYLSVPIYILLFIGFSMVSTTISIIRNNIENLMKRVKREVRRELERQIADAAAEGRGLDLDTSQLVADVLEKHATGMLSNLVPTERKMEFAAATVEKVDKVQALTYGSVETQTDSDQHSGETKNCQTVLDVIDEETATQVSDYMRSQETLTQPVPLRTQKVQFSPVVTSSSTFMPATIHRDKGTYHRPVVQHKSSQSPNKVLIDKGGQKGASVSNKIAQASPTVSSKNPDTRDLIQTRSQISSAAPHVRTAKIQVHINAKGEVQSPSDSTPSLRDFNFSAQKERSAMVRQRWRSVIARIIDILRSGEIHPLTHSRFAQVARKASSLRAILK